MPRATQSWAQEVEENDTQEARVAVENSTGDVGLCIEVREETLTVKVTQEALKNLGEAVADACNKEAAACDHNIKGGNSTREILQVQIFQALF